MTCNDIHLRRLLPSHTHAHPTTLTSVETVSATRLRRRAGWTSVPSLETCRLMPSLETCRLMPSLEAWALTRDMAHADECALTRDMQIGRVCSSIQVINTGVIEQQRCDWARDKCNIQPGLASTNTCTCHDDYSVAKTHKMPWVALQVTFHKKATNYRAL